MGVQVNEGWLIAAAVALLGWGTWVTRRAFFALTRREHERICAEQQAQTAQTLQEILAQMKTADARATAHRDIIVVQVGVMEQKIAVLKDRSDRAEKETPNDRRRRIQRNAE